MSKVDLDGARLIAADKGITYEVSWTIRAMADELALARAVVEAAARLLWEDRGPHHPETEAEMLVRDALAAYRAKVGGTGK